MAQFFAELQSKETDKNDHGAKVRPESQPTQAQDSAAPSSLLTKYQNPR
jgi:hypothetical protein